MAKLVDGAAVSKQSAKEILAKMYETDDSVDALVDRYGVRQDTNADELVGICRSVICDNSRAANEFLAGKDQAINVLKGKVIKATQGKAKPKLVDKVIRELLTHPTSPPATATPDITINAEDITEKQIDNTIVAPEVTYSVYPNPYNSYFHLTYTLERETLVDIALFSTSGQYIKHLVKSVRQRGPQHITYNPRSSDLAGFYLLRMTFDDKVYVQPLVKE